MLKRSLLLFLILILVGCSGTAQTTAPVASEIPAQATATATISASPTSTSLPTATPTPTQTPTPSLPVGLSTPAPVVSQAINAGNAAGLTLLAVYTGNPNGMTVFSHDGTKATFSSPEGTEIFDLAAGELIGRLDDGIALDNYGFSLGWLSMSDDGNVVGVVNPTAIEVFSSDGTVLYSLENRPNEDYPSLVIMDGIGISPDGKLAAISDCAAGEYDGCPFQVVDTQTGAVVYTWSGKMLELHGSAPLFSPDGSLLATWFDNRLWFWSTTDWSQVAYLPVDERSGWVFSNDGQQIVFGGATVQIWSIAEQKMTAEFTPEGQMYATPYISADGAWVGLVNYDTQGVVWSTETKEQVDSSWLENFDPDRVRLVDGKFEVVTLPGHDVNLWTAEQAENEFRFVQTDAGMKLQMMSNRYGRACWIGLDSAANCSQSEFAALMPDGQIVYGMNNEGTLEIRSTPDNSGEVLASFPWSGYHLYLNGYAPQSNLAFYTLYSSMNNSDGIVYDMEKGVVLKKFNGGRMSGVQYSPDGKYAVFAMNNNPRLDVVVFDLEQKIVAFQQTFQYGVDSSVAFTPDGQKVVLAAATNSQPLNSIQVVDVAVPHKVTTIPFEIPEDVAIRSIAFSPDGALAAAGLSDGRILIAQAADGSPVAEIQAFNDWVDRLVFSPDGTLLVGESSSGYVKFWGIWP